MGLVEEIEAKRAEIHSDGYSMSIGELINMYRDGELDVHPEFQRYFRWTDEQKSKLIESILLGIPLPSIFVSTRQDGVWDVIDGQQRLSTIFELAGILKDREGNTKPPLVLTKTKYLPSLEGKKWDDDNADIALGATNQLTIKRSKIDVKIILSGSSESTKYELFQRINAGGSRLTDQELRNVLMIMVNPDAYRWIASLAEDENFKNCIALSDRQIDEQYHVELVVRFLIFRRISDDDLRELRDLGEFLDDQIVALAHSEDFDTTRQHEEAAFRYVFDYLAKTLEDHSFRRFDPIRQRHTGGFLVSYYEAIACGLGYHYESFSSNHTVPDVEKLSRSLSTDATFRESVTNRNASQRLKSIIPFGRRIFEP